MPLEVDDIAGFFDTYGWRYERGSDGVFRTGFVGDTGHFEIWVQVSEDFVIFVISPFLEESGGENQDAVLELLLRANYDVNLAKFGLDEEGDVSLTVEMPRKGFAYSHFADALTALSHYADLYSGAFRAARAHGRAEVQ